MQRLLFVTLLLLLVATLGANARKGKGHRGHHEKHPAHSSSSQCSTSETRYGKCVPKQKDCGPGLRDATCNGDTKKIPCRIFCNWRKEISDCKYKFTHWGECDPVTNTKSRSGTLKKAMFDADCQHTVTVSKPCSHKHKKPKGERN